MVGDDGGLHRVLLLLAGDERSPPTTADSRPADLDLGGIQPQLYAFGLGISEDVSQRVKTQARAIGNRASALSQERAYLSDRASDGGAVNAEQQSQHRLRQIVPQMNECGRHPVDEHQTMASTGSRTPLPAPTSRSMTAALDPGLPGPGQLLHQTSQMAPRDPGEQPMRQDLSIDRDRHARIMSPASNNASLAITHQLVRE